MSAQPEHSPVPPPAPAPTAAAELLVRIRQDRRSGQWAAAFEADWSRALENSRHSYSLSPLHDVVRAWQARMAAAPAVDAFIASGMDDSDGVGLDDVLGARP
ncbi:DUF6247 family protein [Streptomyces sp. NPDC089799]|uniref:DUF6247 family protein n=1 Tax=Streptomyces sp. NPDC089799 TaxID=3155066 RepID=UPI00343BC162